MKRIYVAGSYSSDNPLQVFLNIKVGIRTGTELLLKGYAPFVPWFDYQFFLQLRDGEDIALDVIQAYSLAWLPVCEAMLVLPGSETSTGTLGEIERANGLSIPVYLDKEDLYKEVEP